MPSSPVQVAPAPLKVAASLAAVEGVLMLMLAVAELASTSGDRLLLGLTTTLFFLLYGGLLTLCAWLAVRGRSWSRGPILLAQLIQLGIAWTLRDALPVLALAALVGVSVVVVVGMLHPASLAYLLADEAPDDDPDDGHGVDRA